MKTYFIRAITGGDIKIGRGVDLEKRLKSLQTGNSAVLQILACIDGDHEKELHSQFGHLRKKGEWFAPGDDLLEFIRSLRLLDIPVVSRDRTMSVNDVANYYRVGPDKVLTWIRSGQLMAVNVASSLCGKPRYRITPEQMLEFEKKRRTSPPEKTTRKRKKDGMVDYYPD